MSNAHYTIRNYQPADFNNYVLLHKEAERLEPIGRAVSAKAVSEQLGRPNYSPEQDLFVAEVAGKLVGYMDVVPERIIGRIILYCWVHPEHRRRGLATKLLSYALKRAKELGVKVAHVDIMEDNVVAKSVLLKFGFKYVQRDLKLRLDMAKVRWQDIEQAALGCRHLQPGEEDKLTQIQNRSFAGTWGYNPNTLEEITYYLNLRSRSPEDVVLACEGDKVVGYCWTGITHEEEASSERKGLIYMIGTDPEYRGKGTGKRVLLAGLAHLRNRGMRVTELNVNSENEVAYELYRSVGFEVHTSSLWYEKSLD